MVCSFIFSIESISDLLVWPTGCDYYFYLKILFGLLVIITWTLYKVEKNKNPINPDFFGSLAVSSLAILILGFIGTLIENSDNIPMIQPDILLYILAVTIPIIIIWIFKD